MSDDWPVDPQARLSKLVHDLRTPLTVVEGFGDLLERRLDKLPEAELREFVARMVSGAREMRAILDDERATRRL